MRVQGAQLPNVNLRGLPTPSAGPTASAENFGAGINRQIGQFGRAVQNFGEEVIRQDQIKRQRHDQAVNRGIDNQAHLDSRDAAQKIFSTKGRDAKNSPEEMEKWFDQNRKRYEDMLENDHQRRAFESSYSALRTQYVAKAIDHRDTQDEIYQRQIPDVVNQTLTLEGADSAEASNTPDGMAADKARLQMIFENVDQKYAGMPEETKSLARRKAAMTYHQAKLDAMLPETALKYLDQDGVAQAFGAGATKKMREGFQAKAIEGEQKAIVNAGVSRMIAMARAGADPGEVFADLVGEVGLETASKAAAGFKTFEGLSEKFTAGQEKAREEALKERKAKADEILTRSATSAGREGAQLSEQEARDLAYATFPEKYAEIYLKAYDAERKAIAADKAAAAIRRDEALGQELKDANYDALRMPSWPSLSIEEQQKYLAAGQKLQVNQSLYLRAKFDMSDEELAALFADPERRAEFAEQMGGVDSQPFKDIAAKATKLSANPTGGKDGGKITTLDTDLNNVKRSALNALAATGRTLSTEEEDKIINQTIEYARKEYEAEMAREKVDDVKALPLATRNRIQAQAVLTYEIDRQWPISNRYVSQAEAWAENIDLKDATIVGSSLPPDVRVNYTGSGVIKNERGQGGPILIESNVAPGNAPEGVRTAQRSMGGTIIRDLVEGGWMLIAPNAVYTYAADGSDPLEMSSGEAEAVRIAMQSAKATIIEGPEYAPAGDDVNAEIARANAAADLERTMLQQRDRASRALVEME